MIEAFAVCGPCGRKLVLELMIGGDERRKGGNMSVAIRLKDVRKM